MKQILYRMDKIDNSKQIAQTINKSLDNKKTSSTELLCPKYRRIPSFNHNDIIKTSEMLEELEEEERREEDKTKNPFEKSNFSENITQRLENKNHQTVSMIDINKSSKIPDFDEKKISANLHVLSKQSSSSEVSTLSFLPNLKLRKQLTSKFRSREASMTQEQFKFQIKDHFSQLNTIIEKTSAHFQKRMKTHEDELLKIMMFQIKRVNQECQKTILKYNQLIKNNTTSDQIDQARLQTMYYRNQTLEFKKQNEQLRKEIKYLKRLNSEYEMKMKTDADALRQMGEKLFVFKQKHKHIKKSLLEEVISKRSQKLKQLNLETKQNLNLSLLECTTLQGSKIVALTKNNSKSLDQTKISTQQKSLKSMKIKTDIVSQTSSNRSLRNSFLMKLNKEINSKYKVNKSVEQYCPQSPNKNQLSEFQVSNRLPELPECQERAQNETNRQKIMKFLKEARPSIKTIIQQKKSLDKKNIKKNQPTYNNEKHFDRIKMIKNRVILSTFQQERWQQFKKNSIEIPFQEQMHTKDS